MQRRDRRRDRPGSGAWRRAGLGGCIVALLAACQTQPPAPAPAPQPDPRPEQRQTLRSLGFTEVEGGWMLNISLRILFEVDRDQLTPQMKQTIAKMASELQRAGIRRIRVEGHTDNVGPRAYNMELAQRRADVVAREFVANGYVDSAVVRRAWAFDYPAAPNDTPEGRALNRRVTIVVDASALAVN